MIALVLVLISAPLQLMGYTGTCTQGGDDEVLTGAVLSLPLLLAAGWAMARLRPQRMTLGHRSAGLVAMCLLIATSTIWLSVLRYGNGCSWALEGGYNALYDNGIGVRNGLTVCSYLLLPLLIVVLARFDRLLRPI